MPYRGFLEEATELIDFPSKILIAIDLLCICTSAGFASIACIDYHDCKYNFTINWR